MNRIAGAGGGAHLIMTQLHICREGFRFEKQRTWGRGLIRGRLSPHHSWSPPHAVPTLGEVQHLPSSRSTLRGHQVIWAGTGGSDLHGMRGMKRPRTPPPAQGAQEPRPGRDAIMVWMVLLLRILTYGSGQGPGLCIFGAAPRRVSESLSP